MYTLHFGVLAEEVSPTHPPRFEDDRVGRLVITGRHDDVVEMALETDGGGFYKAEVQPDTFRCWMERGDTAAHGAHVTVDLDHWPTIREVSQIRSALRALTIIGRPCDWAQMTNAEAWHTTVRYYLFESHESGLPTEIEPEPDRTP